MYFATMNAMELGTVSVTGEDADAPKERLHDRNINDLWRDTGTQAETISVNIGSSTDVDLLIIEGHNFDGEDIEWERYDSGSWTDIVTGWSQSGNDRIVKTASSPVTDTQFRVTVTSMTDPECAEIYMSERVLNIDPLWTMKPSFLPNQSIDYSRSGHRYALKRGDEKWQCQYQFYLDESNSELTDWLTCMSNIDYGLHPFYVYDHEDTWRFVEIGMPVQTPLAVRGNDDVYVIDIYLTEVL